MKASVFYCFPRSGFVKIAIQSQNGGWQFKYGENVLLLQRYKIAPKRFDELLVKNEQNQGFGMTVIFFRVIG